MTFAHFTSEKAKAERQRALPRVIQRKCCPLRRFSWRHAVLGVNRAFELTE